MALLVTLGLVLFQGFEFILNVELKDITFYASASSLSLSEDGTQQWSNLISFCLSLCDANGHQFKVASYKTLFQIDTRTLEDCISPNCWTSISCKVLCNVVFYCNSAAAM